MSEAARPRRHGSGRLALGAGILCSLIGIALVLVATSPGVGVSSDSVYYILAARNLLDGHGLSRSLPGVAQYEPLVHWPPLYPLTLAAMSAAGIDMLVGARWLSAGLFGGTILLVAVMLKRMNAPNGLVFVATLSVAIAVDMVRVHAMAWSEPPCIFLGLLGFLLLDLHLERPRRLLLMAGAVSLAGAFLTRYAGSAYVMVGAVALLAPGARRFKARVTDLALFAATAGIPIAAAMLRNLCAGGSATARRIAFRPDMMPEQLRSGLDTVTVWLLPQPLGPTLRAILLGVVVAGAVGWYVTIRRRARALEPARAARPASSLPAILLGFAVCYLALMLATITLILPMPILDYRNLAPLFPVAVVLALWLVAQGLRAAGRGRFLRLACCVAACVFVAAYAARAAMQAATLSRTGQGFVQALWTQSDVLEHVRHLPADRPIYTNAPDAVYFLAGRGSSYVPMQDASDAELKAFGRELDETSGAVVYCANMRRDYLIRPADLADRLHLKVLAEASDGVIYEVARE